MENSNPQNYQGTGDGGNKYQKDKGAERNDSADGNNGNGDEDDGGGEEVGVEEGEKEKNPNDEGSDQDDRAGDKKNCDNDLPPPLPLSFALDKCNWAQEVNCNFPNLAQLKCQKNECD
jgi:hypothetical protein